MHIELHTIAVGAIIWLLSLAHMYARGKRLGFGAGNHVGVTNTLTMLEKYGILDIKVYDKVIARMRDEKNS